MIKGIWILLISFSLLLLAPISTQAAQEAVTNKAACACMKAKKPVCGDKSCQCGQTCMCKESCGCPCCSEKETAEPKKQ